MKIIPILLYVAISIDSTSGCKCQSSCSGCVNWKWDVCKVDSSCGKFDPLKFEFVSCCDYRPDPEFEDQSASVKQEFLWNKIIQDISSSTYPNPAGIFVESVVTTFRNISDLIPEGRSKYIHSVGWVTQFEYKSLSTKYTGVFKGATGFQRFSLAKAYSDSNITPGFAIKFLRTGVPSANFVAMPSLDGQSGKNFFEKTFTNHPAYPKGFELKLLAQKFKQASNCPLMVGLSDSGTYDKDGKQETPIVPFEVHFKPTDAVQCSECASKDDIDSFMLSIKQGTRLFDVYAYASPEDYWNGNEEHIGQITSSSSMTTSKFGDEQLFFKHEWMEYDFMKYPEWFQSIKSAGKLFDMTGSDDCSLEIPNKDCD